LKETFHYAIECRERLHQSFVSPFSAREGNQSVLSEADSLIRQGMIMTYVHLREVEYPGLDRIYRHGQKMLGPRFLEEVDDILFFDEWKYQRYFEDFPFPVEDADGNPILPPTFHRFDSMVDHLVRHYTPEVMEKQLEPDTNKTILHWLMNMMVDHWITRKVILAEHCLAIMPLEWIHRKNHLSEEAIDCIFSCTPSSFWTRKRIGFVH
jgi:hypothetical protein